MVSQASIRPVMVRKMRDGSSEFRSKSSLMAKSIESVITANLSFAKSSILIRRYTAQPFATRLYSLDDFSFLFCDAVKLVHQVIDFGACGSDFALRAVGL
jgi:hypothetical protein